MLDILNSMDGSTDPDILAIMTQLESETIPPLSLKVKDFNVQYEAADKDSILLVNDLDPILAKNRRMIMEYLITRYSGNSLSVVPACECGATTGAYQVGNMCERCFTEVVQSTERKFQSSMWIKAPEGTPGFINPIMFLMLSKLFGNKSAIVHEVDKVNVMDWLLKFPVKKTVRDKYVSSKTIQNFTELGFKRGLKSFYDQLDLFIEYGFSPKIFNNSSDRKTKQKRADARQWLIDNRDKLFCQYLPLPSKLTFVREDMASGKTAFVDNSTKLFIDAINTVLSIKNLEYKLKTSDKKKSKRIATLIEDRTAMVTAQLAKFYHEYVTKSLSKKGGTIRKHIYGTRSNFTFRCVITSIANPYYLDEEGNKIWHHYRDVHLPWGVGVNIFSLHIQNKLLKMGYTPIEAERLIIEHTNAYHPLLDKLMDEIIKSHPYGKFPVLLNRNPTLLIQSIQLLYITRIKKDPSVRSMSLSLLVLIGFNADFDGDELNGLLITDNRLHEKLRKAYAPSLGILNFHQPKEIGKVLSLPRPTIGTIANWFNEPIKRKRRKQMTT